MTATSTMLKFNQFYDNICGKCLKDAGYRNSESGDAGCPIILEGIMASEIPAEWDVDAGVCDEFEPEVPGV